MAEIRGISAKEAKRIAASMAKEGYKYAEISKALAKKGYRSRKTGKPISGGGVSRLVASHNEGKTKRQPRTRTATPRLPGAESTIKKEMIKMIIARDDLSADQKLGLVEAVTDL